jgi:uncharacterized phiE125 gp8 family phage protein
MIYWPAKEPTAVEDFYIDFTDALEAGETILTKNLVATGVTIDSSSIVDSTVKLWLSGGTEGSVAQVICTITTDGSRTFVETGVLEINGEPVTLAAAKVAQKIDSDDEDEVLGIFLRAAIDTVENVSGKRLTRKIVNQVSTFPSATGAAIRLWNGPVVEILEVKYDDEAAVEQTLADYRTADGHLFAAAGATWPTSAGNGSVRISYVAGYAPTDRERQSLIQAVILLFGHFNNNREAVALSGRATNIELPLGVKYLIGPMRTPGMA